MIRVIAGEKGTGKTAQLVDDINAQAVTENNNIVCIERGNRLDRLLKYQVRLVDMNEYPCSSFDQLLSFISGIYAKDFDITHIYIDSIFKVAQSEEMKDFAAFLEQLDAFLKDKNIAVTIICSSSIESLDESIRKFT
ncbi:MAG: hypothetical protein GXY06_06835 [Clostridiaceae bacterium]|nr:hypothetical protein [Clostridiaceae bacterium]